MRESMREYHDPHHAGQRRTLPIRERLRYARRMSSNLLYAVAALCAAAAAAGLAGVVAWFPA